MKTFRFPACIDASGAIKVPDRNAEEERAWRRFAMESFARGYVDSDAIYDEMR